MDQSVTGATDDQIQHARVCIDVEEERKIKRMWNEMVGRGGRVKVELKARRRSSN